jgi:3,4-dihydroxy 2-butanone 4-phosphate synthase/GTP cyclohydrolase II
LVADDKDRENEGDFLTAAFNICPAVMNFMSKYGGGLICAALPEECYGETGHEMTVNYNIALHESPFAVSIVLAATDIKPAFLTRTGPKRYWL